MIFQHRAGSRARCLRVLHERAHAIGGDGRRVIAYVLWPWRWGVSDVSKALRALCAGSRAHGDLAADLRVLDAMLPHEANDQADIDTTRARAPLGRSAGPHAVDADPRQIFDYAMGNRSESDCRTARRSLAAAER
jgi:hypothetical protein